jgi:hypothetical protein
MVLVILLHYRQCGNLIVTPCHLETHSDSWSECLCTANLLAGGGVYSEDICKYRSIFRPRVQHRDVGMVFLLGGWGMGDSELEQLRPSHFGTAPHHQFLRQHDENEISLIPLGNQVSTYDCALLCCKVPNVNEMRWCFIVSYFCNRDRPPL